MEELNHLMRTNPDNLDRRYAKMSTNIYTLDCLPFECCVELACVCVSVRARAMMCAI